MQSSKECISPAPEKSMDTLISEYETIIREKNTQNITLENQVLHLKGEYNMAHNIIDNQYAKIQELTQTLNNVANKTNDNTIDASSNTTCSKNTDTGELFHGDGWWNDVNLDHIEISAREESDKKLHKQIKYLEFLNNLLRRKLAFRNGTLKMIQDAINGSVTIKHKYADNLDIDNLKNDYNIDKKQVADIIGDIKNDFDKVLDSWSYFNNKSDSKDDDESEDAVNDNNVDDTVDDNNVSDNNVSDNNVDDNVYNSANSYTIDDIDYVSNEDMDIQSWKEDSNSSDIIYNIDNYPGYTENILSNKDGLDEDSVIEPTHSFTSVFPKSCEHTFRNCCLKVVYGEMTSYNLWEENNTIYDIDYWKSYSEEQSAMILNSLIFNYNNYYPDLRDNISKWQLQFGNSPRQNNDVICKIIEWLFY